MNVLRCIPWVIIGVVFPAGIFAAGIRLGFTRKRQSAVLAMFLALLVLVRLLFRFFPGMESGLGRWDAYADLRLYLPLLLGILLMGLAVTLVSSRLIRILSESVGGFLVLLFALYCFPVLVPQESRLAGMPDDKGIVLQSSEYSCGAATAATLVNSLGYRKTEAEMSAMCGTQFIAGTDEFHFLRGIRSVLKPDGHDARLLFSADVGQLQKLRLPVAAVIAHSFRTDHWIVVLSVENGTAIVADPSRGIMRHSMPELARIWRNIVVTLE